MNLKEAYYQIYEQEQLDEISVETVKSASDQAGILAGQAAALGAPEYAKKKREQQNRLYDAQSKKRLTPKVKTTKITREETDFFNYVLEYLVAEGYADTNAAAIKIMANMSEEWRESIVEGEENKEEPQKPFTGEGPKKPKGWRPTGPKLKSGQRPSWHR